MDRVIGKRRNDLGYSYKKLVISAVLNAVFALAPVCLILSHCSDPKYSIDYRLDQQFVATGSVRIVMVFCLAYNMRRFPRSLGFLRSEMVPDEYYCDTIHCPVALSQVLLAFPDSILPLQWSLHPVITVPSYNRQPRSKTHRPPLLRSVA